MDDCFYLYLIFTSLYTLNLSFRMFRNTTIFSINIGLIIIFTKTKRYYTLFI